MTREEEIEIKLTSSDPHIRASILENKDLPYDILMKLARDKDLTVRHAVAQTEQLQHLIQPNNPK